jgi:dGTPase
MEAGHLDASAHSPAAPWIERTYVKMNDGDPRDPFDRDRDRILHCESFRRLQHKTQVFIVTESDLFRTRITHSLETAQIGRSLAKELGLNESLTEAICLGHDVGHTPFGHIGEMTLDDLLKQSGGWNSNAHSLTVLDELEIQYPQHRGLDLTWATREGIARHKTKFDEPIEGFADYPSPSLEAQCANLADPIAYATHDVHDALQYRLLTRGELHSLGLAFWDVAWRKTRGEFDVEHPEGTWPGVDLQSVMTRRVHRHMIDYLMWDALVASSEAASFSTVKDVRSEATPVIRQSPEVAREVDRLLDFMLDQVYKGPLVARQNHKSQVILQYLFNTLTDNVLLLPVYVRERIEHSSQRDREVAHFLGSLTDRSAIDLYNELCQPQDRSMGHHVL